MLYRFRSRNFVFFENIQDNEGTCKPNFESISKCENIKFIIHLSISSYEDYIMITTITFSRNQ